jgi:prolyl oligopeptidase
MLASRSRVTKLSNATSGPTVDNPDDDPWLWLEEVDSERVLTWTETQSSATLARFADADFAADRDALTAILNHTDKISLVTRRGDFLYDLWQDAAQPRGVWRRTTLEDYRSGTPTWEILLDLDALAAREGADWVWVDAVTFPPLHDRAILRMSCGGSDAVALREFDLSARCFVLDGFVLPASRSKVEWLDRDTVLLASALGEAMETHSGHPRTIRLWRRGMDALTAPVLFKIDAASIAAWATMKRWDSNRYILFGEYIDFFNTTVYLGDHTGPIHRLSIPVGARFCCHREWLAIQPRQPWELGGVTYSSDSVLGFHLPSFVAGEQRAVLLWKPEQRCALQNFFWVDGNLVLSTLVELRSEVRIFTPGPGAWTEASLAGLPEIGVVSVWQLDFHEEESDGSLLISVQDPVTPPTLMLRSPKVPKPSILKGAPRAFNPNGLTVCRHEAISVDGARIPYIQVGPKKMSGDAPVHLTGYGGFGIPMLPYYNTQIGKLWLEKGGTSVIANIRGGGEFGSRWHNEGRLERKILSHDDFASVAVDLIRRGVTHAGRIAAEGSSNGGLLVGNMLTRYPEHFGGLFCTVPLLDMRRYTKLFAGVSWIAEYGDPAKPEDWDFLKHISAYHNVLPGRLYPRILLATMRRDDRVHPAHARKMAARLQAVGADAWFYEAGSGGHNYGARTSDVAAISALGATFLRKSINWYPDLDSNGH